jgi:hypothetical protein
VIDLDELVGFLEERLDDDEYRATAARSESWTVERDASTIPGNVAAESRIVIGADGESGIARVNGRDRALHIALHDRARVLHEIDAKRRILERVTRIERDAQPRTVDPPLGANVTMVSVLEMLALPYADHADYRAEWRP